ncbi:hypothetical protein A2U01_0019490, partial [Trifolium medium]|nr:hypothetical protein [Trifolium medium]
LRIENLNSSYWAEVKFQMVPKEFLNSPTDEACFVQHTSDVRVLQGVWILQLSLNFATINSYFDNEFSIPRVFTSSYLLPSVDRVQFVHLLTSNISSQGSPPLLPPEFELPIRSYYFDLLG